MRDTPPLPDDEPEEPAPRGHLRPTTGRALGLSTVLGLVAGRLLRPVFERLTGSAPQVSWLPGLALLFVAAALGLVAWQTWRLLHVHRGHLEPQLAVNRLVLARASALVGAVVAAGYVGYAIGWLGDPSELADERIVRSLFAAVGGVAITISSLLLERACRAPGGDEHA